MRVFIVGVPLFDNAMVVKAYRLCHRSGERAIGIQNDFRRMTEAFDSPGLDLIEQIGLEPFAGDQPLFIDLNVYQILTGKPAGFRIDPSKLICIIPADIAITDQIVEKCQILSDKGYRMAFKGMPADIGDHPLLPMVDYIMLDYLDPGYTTAQFYARTYCPNVSLVFDNIPDEEAYERLSGRNPGGLFTGGFYNRPITEGVVELSPVKINALQLLSLVNRGDFEFEQTVEIIERDPYLTISLLRFINSAAIGLGTRIDSIMRAVTILGQREIRRWANVAISVSLAEDRPGEITKLALTRAKFAENLAPLFGIGDKEQGAFLAGLFSLIDIILQLPMEEALKEVALDEGVKRALINQTGEYFDVLDFMYTYERADWDQCAIIMIQNEIEFEAVNKAFVEAAFWYHSLIGIIAR